MSHRATRWVALTVGLAFGLATGFVYTWLIDPVELVNTDPALMRRDYRQDWVRLAALSYVVDGDLEQARSRLERLNQQDVAIGMQDLIEDYAAAGRPAETLRRLAVMARALGVYTPAMLVYQRTPTRAIPPSATPTPSNTPSPTPSNTPTNTPTATPTRRPTATPTITPSATPSPVGSPLPSATPSPSPTASATPTPTPGPPYQLSEQELQCDPDQVPHIEVIVEDQDGNGVSGMEVWLLWNGGADRAVTGLKPANGTGYVDFSAEEDVSYTITVGDLGRPLVNALKIEECSVDEDEERLAGAWRIVILHRRVETE